MWMLANAEPGLSTELVLSVRAWKGPSRVQGFCSVRCWVLREHVSVFLSEKRQGSARLRTARVTWQAWTTWWGVWLFFENCTVDASIFVASY
jgi:hypothetical protein